MELVDPSSKISGLASFPLLPSASTGMNVSVPQEKENTVNLLLMKGWIYHHHEIWKGPKVSGQ